MPPEARISHKGGSSGFREVVRVHALTILQVALVLDNCEGKLRELEEPYIARHDPYSESKPIQDPTWFYGRQELLTRLPLVLAQGQHVGIFGLRKVGKTSLVIQLRQRFVATPTVFMDCQGFSAQSGVYFQEILSQLTQALPAHGVKKLGPIPSPLDMDSFRQTLVAWFGLWQKAGYRDPFLLIFDEVDKLFPDRALKGSETILVEYVHLFRVLRGLAQTHRCLVTLVIGYRADVNRHNQLTSAVGENPMYRSFKEEYLGFLSQEESQHLIEEVGLWRDIRWATEAAQRVFHYCGGHPLTTRMFASQACDEGDLKMVNLAKAEETAEELARTFRKNDIGNYYEESIWSLLREEERQVLTMISQNGPAGLPEDALPKNLDEDLSNLDHFGVVESHNGSFVVTADLFRQWVERKVKA